MRPDTDGTMNITLTQMLNLMGKLDDSQGQDTASCRFRSALALAKVAHTEEEDIHATTF